MAQRILLGVNGATILADGYCTLDMVQTACGGSDILLQLSDLENTGAIDPVTVDSAIADADAIIDSYLGQRSDVPLAEVPRSVQNISAAWAARILRSNRNKGVVLPEDQKAEERDEKWLALVSKGLVSLGVDPAPPRATFVIDKAGQRPTTLAISSARMKGFI